MFRKAILSAIVGGIALVAGIVSADAAPLPKTSGAVEASTAGIVQEVGYRHYRHRHYSRHHRPHYFYYGHYRRHHHHYRHHHHRHHYHHHHRRNWR